MVDKKIFNIGFTKHKQIIKENLNVICKKSVRYPELMNDLDITIILVDKLLYRIALDNNNNENVNIIIELDKYFYKITNNCEDKIDILKLIFKSMCWFWSHIVSDNILTIFNEEITIPSLVDKVINLEGLDCNEDQYINVLKEAKQTYIALYSGNDYDVRKNSDISLKCQIIMCIILPAYLNRKKIMDWTSELQIGEFDDIEMEQLLTIVKDEYLNLQSSFVERNISVDQIYKNVKGNKMTIIKGKSGSGKSTILANIIEKLSIEKYGNVFSSSIIVHSFKHSKNIHDLVNSVVKQCNSMLVNKIDTRILNEIQTEYNFWSNSQVQLNENKFNNIYDIYKKLIKEVVNCFIIEHGEIYIFIDSLELVNVYENEIENLFIDLSTNAHIVICTDENNEGIYGIASDKDIEKNIIEIGYLSLDETSFILKQIYEVKEKSPIIAIIFEKTKGNIKLIKDLFERAKASGTDIIEFMKNNTTEIENENAIIYNDLANKWILLSTDVLEETLFILAIFESINYISLDKLQSFLKYKDYSLRMPKIRKFLNKVDEQIVYINNKIKLSNTEFAEFVVNKVFSKKDIECFVTDLFNWICKCLGKEYNFTLDFFKYLVKRKLINEVSFKNNLNSFIEQKKNDGEGQYLFEMGFLMVSESKNMVEYSIKLIKSAVELSNSDAMGFLGYCFLKGKYIEKNITKGKNLLNQACESGNIISKSILGQMLIQGDCVEREAERGGKLLFEASTEGNINAKLNLSVMLITGKGIKSNPIQGRELLYELIRDNNPSAMLIMGSYTMDGLSMERDTDKGLKLINKAIEQGSIEAKLELAIRLINGDGVAEDKSEGFRMLEEMLDSGNIEAKRALARKSIVNGNIKRGCELFEELIRDEDSNSILVYAKLIMDEKIPKENEYRAMELLKKEIERKNVAAMRQLGEILLEAHGVKGNVKEGIRLLEEAISSEDVASMRELGYKLANGIDIMKHKERGEMLLVAAAERGDIAAKVLYALTLLNNYTDQYNKSKALQLIDEAVSYGDIYAKLKLSNILFEGKLIKKDVKRATQLLEDCIVSGNSQAMRILGYRLLNGVGVPYDINRAKELLLKVVNNNDSLGKIIFGEAIILEYFEGYTIDEGVLLLEQAALKEHEAEKVLGILLIKGINIAQDKTRGEALLKNAAQKGNINAIRKLYNMLLDGRYLEQNIEEGKKYLMKAIEANDDGARIDFAERLLDGDILKQNRIKGQQIFDELISQNVSEAMCEYGERLISGKGVIRDKLRGKNLLQESIAIGNMRAKRILALSIIDGEIDNRSKDEAIKLLEENVLELDEMTMVVYGGMLIDGNKIEANVSRGMKLLEECSNFKNSMGKYYLGKRLIEGRGVEQKIEEGLALLEENYSRGYEETKMYLAELKIDGRYVTKNTDEGIEIFSNLMINGNEEAQRMLACILIKGDGIKRNKDRGVSLLNELVERENTDAMECYGEMLLDGFYIERNLVLGRELLNRAIRKGNYYASYLLGKRLLSGSGIKKHKSRGIKAIKRAIKHDIISASFEYGIRLKYGIGVATNIEDGENRIEDILNTSNIQQKYSLGVIAYDLKDYELATQLFYDEYTNKFEEASISLAYMIRRNEVKGETSLPDIYKLLEKPLKNKVHNAYINLALYYIRKNEKNQDWEKLDEVFRCLDYCGEAAEWWYEISKKGDLEGDLVLGLMDRYGLIPGLSDIPFDERLNKVNKNGWDIPAWMFEEIETRDQVAATKE